MQFSEYSHGQKSNIENGRNQKKPGHLIIVHKVVKGDC